MRNSINHNFAGVRIQSQESYDSIITDKVLTFHTIKSVVNTNKNNCCHSIFFRKG